MLTKVDWQSAAGKIVQRVSHDELDNRLFVIFTDGTFLHVNSARCGDETELEDDFRLNYWNSHQCFKAGIITEEEVKEMERKHITDRENRVRNEELAQLAKLKSKYPGA